MSAQLYFFLSRAISFIQSGNLTGAELLLNQVINKIGKNSEAFRYLSIIASSRGNYSDAMRLIDSAIDADKGNEAAHSVKGDIQQRLGMFSEAQASYQKAIKCNPNYAEAINNLGNTNQELGQILSAIDCYNRAIALKPTDSDFYCNLGNALWKLDRLLEARQSYEKSISFSPKHSNSIHNLAHIDLREFNFADGWDRYESRWLVGGDSQPLYLNTSKPRWGGVPKENRLFVWAEQGIGDQILYASMFRELAEFPQSVTISADKKLLSIFRRSFPKIQFVDREAEFSEEFYDEHIPMGSLGSIFRPDFSSFKRSSYPYLTVKEKSNINSYRGIICGISWRSGRTGLGKNKSIPLVDLAPILELKNMQFIRLQHGDVDGEISELSDGLRNLIQTVKDIDLYHDIDGLLSIIDSCDIVITSSNSTAHIAGALGKETLLVLPMGNAKFWYWSDVDGASLWYPSIKVFKQEKLGDWSQPIQALKSHLESKFAA